LKLVTPPLFELSILPNWPASYPTPVTHPRAIPLDERSSISLSDVKPFVAWQSFSTSRPASDWLLVLVVIAVMGTLAVAIRTMAQTWWLRRALRHGGPNDDRLNRIATGAGEAMSLAYPIPVCVVAANVSPLLWIRRSGPLIVVPRRLCDELSDEQLGCVVAHEIAHFLRRDHWTNLLSLLVAAVCWWNPVVWWARRELRIAQEACCDALVISRSVVSRRKYAETLFQALEFLQAERSLLPALASGFGNKSSTERRFEMIANPNVSHRLSWWSFPVLFAALAALPCLPSFTQAQDQGGRSQAIDVDYGLVPVEIKDLDGDPLDANSFHVEVQDLDGDPRDLDRRVKIFYPSSPWDAIEFTDPHSRPVVIRFPGQTDRRVYKYHRSKLGVVVLAFQLESGKLAWSSEIELPPDGKAVANRQFLLHTGGGVVTIAVVKDENSLTIQELDAQTGKLTAECRLAPSAKDRFNESAREFEKTFKIRIETLMQRHKELQQQLKTKEEQRNDTSGAERKETDKMLNALKDQLQRLIDEQLIQVGDRALRGPADRGAEQKGSDFWRRQEEDVDWQFQEANDLGDALVIATDGRPTIEMAGTVWRLINGDAPVESIRMVREGGKDRMIIEGKAKKQLRVILEISTDGDKAGSTDGGLPPGGASTGEETSAHTSAADSLVRQAVQYLSRRRMDAPAETPSGRQ
jgi:beta-lactamase regulating signal transducer with metallopeptidase domain